MVLVRWFHWHQSVHTADATIRLGNSEKKKIEEVRAELASNLPGSANQCETTIPDDISGKG